LQRGATLGATERRGLIDTNVRIERRWGVVREGPQAEALGVVRLALFFEPGFVELEEQRDKPAVGHTQARANLRKLFADGVHRLTLEGAGNRRCQPCSMGAAVTVKQDRPGGAVEEGDQPMQRVTTGPVVGLEADVETLETQLAGCLQLFDIPIRVELLAAQVDHGFDSRHGDRPHQVRRVRLPRAVDLPRQHLAQLERELALGDPAQERDDDQDRDADGGLLSRTYAEHGGIVARVWRRSKPVPALETRNVPRWHSPRPTGVAL